MNSRLSAWRPKREATRLGQRNRIVLCRGVEGRDGNNSHVIGQLLEVGFLLLDLLAELYELLLLAHANGIVLAGLLSALEGVSVIR